MEVCESHLIAARLSEAADELESQRTQAGAESWVLFLICGLSPNEGDALSES